MATSREPKLVDKVALITGSSAGIGAGIAIDFSRHGAKVVITGRSQEKLDKIACQCEAASGGKNKPLVIGGEITDPTLRKKLIQDTLDHFGKIDILVNNAGYFAALPLDKPDDELQTLDSMLDIHLRVPYDLSKLAIPHLIKTKGNIINISSVAGIKPQSESNGVEYSVAKAALDHFTKWLALELGPKGVRANSINPGHIRTDILRNFPQEIIPKLEEASAKLHPLKRIGEVEEVAKVATLLASDDGSFVSGVIMPVDGAWCHMPPQFPDLASILSKRST